MDVGKENHPPSAEPEPKRAKLSLSLPKDRFSFSVDDKDLEDAMKKYSAKNTALNNKWALKNFEDWFKAKRNTTEKPKTAIERDVFYVCPSTVYKPDQPWYTSVPVGRNKLSSMVKKMCSLAVEEEW